VGHAFQLGKLLAAANGLGRVGLTALHQIILIPGLVTSQFK
jgi:hypothetical protein